MTAATILDDVGRNTVSGGKLTATVVVVAGLAAAWFWLDDPRRGVGVPTAAVPTPAVAERAAWRLKPLPALETVSETRQRPVFSPGRRPPPSPEQTGVALSDVVATLALGQHRVTGVVITDTEQIVLLRNIESGKSMQMRPGDIVDGWRLEAVTVDSVTIERNGQSRTVTLGQTAE